MTKIYTDLSEKLSTEKEKQKLRKRIYNVIDSLISIFVVSPLVVGFW